MLPKKIVPKYKSLFLLINMLIKSIDLATDRFQKATSSDSELDINLIANKLSNIMLMAQSICFVHGEDLEAAGYEIYLHKIFYALDKANKVFSTIESLQE